MQKEYPIEFTQLFENTTALSIKALKAKQEAIGDNGCRIDHHEYVLRRKQEVISSNFSKKEFTKVH